MIDTRVNYVKKPNCWTFTYFLKSNYYMHPETLHNFSIVFLLESYIRLNFCLPFQSSINHTEDKKMPSKLLIFIFILLIIISIVIKGFKNGKNVFWGWEK